MNTIKTPLEAKHFIDSEGKYLGAFAGLSVRTVNDKEDLEEEYIEMPELPPDAIEVPEPPEDGRQIWDINTKQWGPKPAQPTQAELHTKRINADKFLCALIEEMAERFDDSPEKLKAALVVRMSKS
jgi:hypothetical protein